MQYKKTLHESWHINRLQEVQYKGEAVQLYTKIILCLTEGTQSHQADGQAPKLVARSHNIQWLN